ncbi:MAG TPA: protein kinase [Terriglobales bacterium]
MATARQIGPFEVLEALGAGGMGEVFKARDTRLNRYVAIKFLPEAASPLARERFQREAQAIGSLNHPHICTLHEVGEDHGRPFLVLELLEGETLFHRLQRGPVPMPQLAQWGAEIADALQAAHAKGILHRDLKPANIFITPRGSVKVLDFGLAQFAQEAAAGADTMTSPGAAPLTSPGTTLGTWAYMSPEQARGEPTDARSDLFSCGVVLYEMAGGQPPFRGRTSADLSAAILTFAPPPPSSLQPAVPAKLDDLISECLQKDPDLRLQTAADLRAGLRRLQAPNSSAGPTSSAAAVPAAPAAAAKRRAAGWLWPVVAGVAILAAGSVWWLRRGPAAAPSLQFRQLTYSGQVHDAVISPDGKFLAHVDSTPAGTSLHLLAISSNSDVQIVPPSDGCCRSPSFSPDGGMVYFLQDHTLKAVPVLGGDVRTIVPEGASSGAAFSPDGSHIAYIRGVKLLMIADAGGAGARLLTKAGDGGFVSNYWNNGPGALFHSPTWSPDGKNIAVILGPTTGAMHVQVIQVADGQVQTVGPGITFPGMDLNWLPDGSGLVFTANIPDPDVPQVWEMSYPGGRLTRLTNDLQGYGGASVARSGELVLVHGVPQASVWDQAKAGSEFVQVPGGGANLDGSGGVAWTPQGRLITTRTQGTKNQIWTEDADGSHARQLTSPGSPGLLYHPLVTPDGGLIFTGTPASADGVWVPYRANADGSGMRPLVTLPPGASAVDASALVEGGRQYIYAYADKQTEQTLWMVPSGGGTPRQLWDGYVLSDGIAVAPDGHHIMLLSRNRATGISEPVLLDLSTTPMKVTTLNFDLKVQLPNYGFTPDGRALTFIHRVGSSDNIWAMPLDGGKTYPITHFPDLGIVEYAYSSDGRLAVSRFSPSSDAVVATGLGGSH